MFIIIVECMIAVSIKIVIFSHVIEKKKAKERLVERRKKNKSLLRKFIKSDSSMSKIIFIVYSSFIFKERILRKIESSNIRNSKDTVSYLIKPLHYIQAVVHCA